MQRQRLQLAGERRQLGGPVQGFSFQASQTRYQQVEVEDRGAIGTTFKSACSELRLQARQAPAALWGGKLGGVPGLQLARLDFSALGAEAFVPTSHTRSTGVFVLQELVLPGSAMTVPEYRFTGVPAYRRTGPTLRPGARGPPTPADRPLAARHHGRPGLAARRTPCAAASRCRALRQ
jgi:hypothetical protein